MWGTTRFNFGPIAFFLICINGLCTVCKNTIPVLFADDTNLFSSGLDATGIQDGVNHDLAISTEWLQANKLSLNTKKTHYMCFSAKNKVKLDISLKIDGEIVAEVTSSKCLGVITDDKLNWKDHVSFVCRKGRLRRYNQGQKISSKWVSQKLVLLIYISLLNIL